MSVKLLQRLKMETVKFKQTPIHSDHNAKITSYGSNHIKYNNYVITNKDFQTTTAILPVTLELLTA